MSLSTHTRLAGAVLAFAAVTGTLSARGSSSESSTGDQSSKTSLQTIKDVVALRSTKRC